MGARRNKRRPRAAAQKAHKLKNAPRKAKARVRRAERLQRRAEAAKA